MKLILLARGESRRSWIRLGNDNYMKHSAIRESKNSRCYASSHRHGGVGGVGTLRSVIETSREILISANGLHKPEATGVTSSLNENIMADKEDGMAHSSVEGSVMETGTKEPYLVDVNREARACTSLVLVRMGLHFASCQR
jgi:hypothetical protein